MDDRQSISTADGTISYREAGQGDHVILLHGIGSSSASWETQLEKLAERWKLIAWDAPGYGNSDPLPYSKPVASQYAARLAHFLDAKQISSCHVVGHSLGAIIACSFVRSFANRVESLMIASPAAGYGSAPKHIQSERRRGRIELLEKLGPERLAQERHSYLLSDNAGKVARERVRNVMAQIRPAGYRQAVELLTESDIKHDALEISLPVFVVVGGADTVTPLEECQKIATYFKKSNFEVLPDIGHACYVEDPICFNTVLIKHLEGGALKSLGVGYKNR